MVVLAATMVAASMVVVVVEAHMAVVVEADMVMVDLVEMELQARYVLYGLAVHVASQVHA